MYSYIFKYFIKSQSILPTAVKKTRKKVLVILKPVHRRAP